MNFDSYIDKKINQAQYDRCYEAENNVVFDIIIPVFMTLMKNIKIRLLLLNLESGNC